MTDSSEPGAGVSDATSRSTGSLRPITLLRAAVREDVSVTAPDLTDVEAALRRARIAVAEHTDAMAIANATWREETATELVLANTHPTVRFADFN